MQIYLPIAELSVNMFTIFAMGGGVGLLSGLFGIGGGFLLTPLLIFSGISPVVAVATVTAQIVASSASGAITYWQRRLIDVKLAFYLLSSGIVGAALGVWLFSLLQELGQLDLVISLSYVSLLGIIGGLMMTESVRTMWRNYKGRAVPLRHPGQHSWVHGLPLKVRFRRSRLYVSAIPVLGLGASIGFLGAVLGIGGGFIMVPTLIYLLHVPTNMVVGTSLLQTVVTMGMATMMHAVSNQNVDIVLAVILMVGAVIGAQFGVRIGRKLQGEHLRALLALIVLSVGARFAIDLFVQPDELYSFRTLGGSTEADKAL